MARRIGRSRLAPCQTCPKSRPAGALCAKAAEVIPMAGCRADECRIPGLRPVSSLVLVFIRYLSVAAFPPGFGATQQPPCLLHPSTTSSSFFFCSPTPPPSSFSPLTLAIRWRRSSTSYSYTPIHQHHTPELTHCTKNSRQFISIGATPSLRVNTCLDFSCSRVRRYHAITRKYVTSSCSLFIIKEVRYPLNTAKLQLRITRALYVIPTIDTSQQH